MRNPNPGLALYSASKVAAIALTRRFDGIRQSPVLSKCLAFLVFPAGQRSARCSLLDRAVQLRTPELDETGNRNDRQSQGPGEISQANRRTPVAHCDDRLFCAAQSKDAPLLAAGVLLP